MRGYIAKRLLLSIPTILGALTLVFFAMRLTPGDPAALFVPPDVPGQSSAALYAKIRHEYGFDKPLYVQYWDYLTHVAHLDFGDSLRYKQPVTQELASRIPNTLQLGLIALAAATVLGIGLGIVSAVHRGSWIDDSSVVGALLGISVPSFWLALLLISLLALRFPIFPVSGFGGPFYTLDGLRHIAMPAAVLAVGGAGGLARYTRSAMLEVLNNDYIRTARAKGVAERTVIIRHALRNALPTIITLLGLGFGSILGGAVIIETVFSWPGVGRYLISAINGRDYPAVEATVLLIAVSFVFANLVTDLLLAYVDPRIRYD